MATLESLNPVKTACGEGAVRGGEGVDADRGWGGSGGGECGRRPPPPPRAGGGGGRGGEGVAAGHRLPPENGLNQ